jgi:hypothetical protein
VQRESSGVKLGKRGFLHGTGLSQEQSGHPRIGDPQLTPNVAAGVEEEESLRLNHLWYARGRGLAQGGDGDSRQQQAQAHPSPPGVLPLQPVEPFAQDL